MHDISNYNGLETEPLLVYHARIKEDLTEFMLKRMVGDVRTIKERAEFMNACAGAAGVMAAGQAAFLASQCDDPERKHAIESTALGTALHEMTLAYEAYLKAVHHQK